MTMSVLSVITARLMLDLHLPPWLLLLLSSCLHYICGKTTGVSLTS